MRRSCTANLTTLACLALLTGCGGGGDGGGRWRLMADLPERHIYMCRLSMTAPLPAMQNRAPMDEAEITAIHEAAHAVAAIRTGLIFDHVTAQPDYDLELEGQLQWGELQASGDIEVPRELLAIVLLAGPCAEARVTRRELDDVFSDEEALDDRESLAGLMLDAEKFVQASRDTLELLDADWPLIERVAGELLEVDSLGYDEVSALVAAHDG